MPMIAGIGTLMPGITPAREHVVVVQRCGLDRHNDVAFAWLRIGEAILELEDFRPAVFL